MTSNPTYRIKPLVWEQQPDGSWLAMGMFGCRVQVWYHHEHGWMWNIENGNFDDSLAHSRPSERLPNTLSAKAAAESAYRKLVAEHLEVVR